jgi:hypothetical protein
MKRVMTKMSNHTNVFRIAYYNYIGLFVYIVIIFVACRPEKRKCTMLNIYCTKEFYNNSIRLVYKSNVNPYKAKFNLVLVGEGNYFTSQNEKIGSTTK